MITKRNFIKSIGVLVAGLFVWPKATLAILKPVKKVEENVFDEKHLIDLLDRMKVEQDPIFLGDNIFSVEVLISPSDDILAQLWSEDEVKVEIRIPKNAEVGRKFGIVIPPEMSMGRYIKVLFQIRGCTLYFSGEVQASLRYN